MRAITFITGNQNKADYLAKYLGHPVDHVKLELDEIQSLDLQEIVQHKVRQAYEQVRKPVIVEDVALEFTTLGRLPGPFIKWFLEEMPLDDLCKLVDGKDRTAQARCMYGYYDGTREAFFEGGMAGRVAKVPAGDGGYGWDKIFIPAGHEVTRAELSEEEYKTTYLKIKPVAQLKQFLSEDQK